MTRPSCVGALPDLDGLIAEVDRRCAGARSDTSETDWLALLNSAAEVVAEIQALADDLIDDYVERGRMHGCTWVDIGNVLGVTRQAAQQRFVAPRRQYSEEEPSDEQKQAFASMKEVAVRHRNNYIGTEHVLWGLLAMENTATARLRAVGVTPEELRRQLEVQLSIGSSQAAERIAWTPYARKAMALASGSACETIRCEDLLLGLMRVGRGVAADVLAKQGVTPAAFQARND